MALCDKLKKKGRKKANKERARAEDYEAKAVQEATAGRVNARVNEEADERAAVRHLLRRRAHAYRSSRVAIGPSAVTAVRT